MVVPVVVEEVVVPVVVEVAWWAAHFPVGRPLRTNHPPIPHHSCSRNSRGHPSRTSSTCVLHMGTLCCCVHSLERRACSEGTGNYRTNEFDRLLPWHFVERKGGNGTAKPLKPEQESYRQNESQPLTQDRMQCHASRISA